MKKEGYLVGIMAKRSRLAADECRAKYRLHIIFVFGRLNPFLNQSSVAAVIVLASRGDG